MRSEANSFLRQVKASTCYGPHNHAVSVLSRSLRALVCSAKLGQNFISWFTIQGTFAILRHHVAPGVDNGLKFGRIFSNSLPINNLSKVAKPGHREYTISIVQGNAFFLKTIHAAQLVTAHHALFGYDQSPGYH